MDDNSIERLRAAGVIVRDAEGDDIVDDAAIIGLLDQLAGRQDEMRAVVLAHLGGLLTNAETECRDDGVGINPFAAQRRDTIRFVRDEIALLLSGVDAANDRAEFDRLVAETTPQVNAEMAEQYVDLRTAVELADTRTWAIEEKEGMVEVYGIKAADWNRVVAVARGAVSQKARRLTGGAGTLTAFESRELCPDCGQRLPVAKPWSAGRPCSKTSLDRGHGWDGRPTPEHGAGSRNRWNGYGTGLARG